MVRTDDPQPRLRRHPRPSPRAFRDVPEVRETTRDHYEPLHYPRDTCYTGLEPVGPSGSSDRRPTPSGTSGCSRVRPPTPYHRSTPKFSGETGGLPRLPSRTSSPEGVGVVFVPRLRYTQPLLDPGHQPLTYTVGSPPLSGSTPDPPSPANPSEPLTFVSPL